MSDTARVGVIGCGWWSTVAHLPALQRNPDAEIVAVADPNRANRAAAASRFSVGREFDAAEDMFQEVEVDAAVVAVPHAYHYDCARLVLEHGAHLLIEKPMVLRPADARDLLRLAEQHSVEIIVGYPWHYNRQVLRLRDEIADGRIGDIEYVTCLFASVVRELYRGNPEPYRDVLGYTINSPGAATYSDPAISGGGQAQTQVTHAAALLFWMTGLEACTVASFTESFELPVDLMDSVSVRFRGGALGSIGSTGSVLPGEDEILEYRIFGTSGHITFDVNQGAATIFGRKPEALAPLAPELRYPESAPVDNLVDCVLRRGTNGSPGQIGADVVSFVDAIYRSTALGGNPVSVEGS